MKCSCRRVAPARKLSEYTMKMKVTHTFVICDLEISQLLVLFQKYLREILGRVAMAQIPTEECIALIGFDGFINFIRNIESVHVQQSIERP